jgi:N-acetylmuramoyl-L-alanine amidase
MTAQRFLWLLDAGHAHNTPGKRSPPLPDGRVFLEWDFKRTIVMALALRLQAVGIAHHVLTPMTDGDMAPSLRALMANDIARRVELPCRLVSVHSNAFGDGTQFESPHGITCLYYPTSHDGQEMAKTFQTDLVSATGWQCRGIKPRDDLTLLKNTTCPAVITETGFYTNEQQCRQLMDPEIQNRIGAAHAVAIMTMDLA